MKRYINYTQLLELILQISPSLTEAYEIKEEYLYFNQVTTSENARIELARMISLFSNSSIPAYNLFSNTLINWFDEIVNSFTVINGKRLSNGKIESINSRVKIILKNAMDIKTFQYLETE